MAIPQLRSKIITTQPEVASTGLKSRQSEALIGMLMAAPASLLLLVFMIVPFIMAFVVAFTNQRLVSPNPTEFVGIKNFSRLLTIQMLTLSPVIDAVTGQPVLDANGQYTYPALRDYTRNNEQYPQLKGLSELVSISWGKDRTFILASDAVFMRAVFNTLRFVVIIVPGQGGLALLLALLINQPLRGINIFRTIYFVPVVVSMVVVSILWKIIYSPQDGLLNSLLSFFSFGNVKPIDWLGDPNTALHSVMIMSIWQGVGFHMVIWLAGLQTIPATLYEAASVEGANALQKFMYVTWPGLRNTAIFVLVIITMQAFGLFTQINVMTRGGPLDSTQTIVYQAVLRGYGKQDISGGSAISVIFFLMVLVVSVVQRYLTREDNT